MCCSSRNGGGTYLTNQASCAIGVVGLEKSLGSRAILRGVNLRIDYGEIVAIIGANGSGKSLLLRVLSGLVYPDRGRVPVGGSRIDRASGSLADVGVMIEAPGFLPYLSGIDNLRLLAMLRKRIGDEDIANVMRTVGLDPTDRRPVRTYSLGMRQRLGIAQAIMERPRIVLLDEPTNALDPAFTATFLDMLKDLRSAGTAILLTSHELPEVTEVADRILVMRNGILADYHAA